MPISKRRLAEIEGIADADVDLSDVAEVDEAFFRNAKLVLPPAQTTEHHMSSSVQPRPGPPAADQTAEPPQYRDDDWEDYVASGLIAEGAACVVRHTQYGIVRFEIALIEAVDRPTKGRIRIGSAGSFHRKSGKHTFHPKGQSDLAPLTAEVVHAALHAQMWRYGRAIRSDVVFTQWTPEKADALRRTVAGRDLPQGRAPDPHPFLLRR